eukprot:TRINITY_DN3206_c2_g1_i1.p1 TRINITY_DN3206_c2_g1~~TRINITY_DN3206_c2_g1_i1.p1  ORF type:complete len:127 (-),score=15.13 TRINITY_DN3206_c2_g1_i1:43-423(-)
MSQKRYAMHVLFRYIPHVARKSVRSFHRGAKGQGQKRKRRALMAHMSSSLSAASSSSSSSSLDLSSVFLASSSSFFLAFSTSLKVAHFLAKASASATSSVTMTLSKIVPPFTCQRSKPKKPKSSYL